MVGYGENVCSPKTLFVVVPLSSLCARHAGKSCQKLHGRLKSSQLRFESSRLRALCSWPRGGLVAPGFRFDQGISRRLKPSRWEDRRRRTRAWPGLDTTWNGEQSPYETFDIGRGQGSVT